MHSRISITEKAIGLTISGQEKRNHDLSSLQSLHALLIGSDVLSNDSQCLLLVFDKEIWLVPEMTSGVLSFRNHTLIDVLKIVVVK